jgi:Ca-activated chloride channel family protein
MNAARTPRPHVLTSRVCRDIARFAGEALVAGLVVSLALALAIFIVATQAQAAETPPGQGTLLLEPGAGAPSTAAPLLFTHVKISVSGMTARTTVTQRFANPTAGWREGVYVFPLPEKAAVDHLAMEIGSRRIEGEIRERGEARAMYEQAKTGGRKATLVEQERPNVFTTSVAHIGPGEEILVTIEYQEVLVYDAGAFHLRFPMVVAPRYVPGTAVVTGDAGTGWGINSDQVPDAERVTPPVTPPEEGFVNPVTLTVELNPGFPLSAVDSPYHRVDVTESADHRYTVRLVDGAVPANRDFELVFAPDVAAAPGAAVFAERKDGRTYALAMLVPPTAASEEPPASREAVFIIDTSGSMEGTSIAQAKQALAMALDRLHPGDRFNVIEFNSVTRSLFAAPMPVDPATLRRARSFVAGLRARGGTEMRAALDAALTRDAASGFVRQVVFLTDGAVGNEGDLLELIRARVGDRRLFTIGIGSAPNAYFLTKAAQFGRGTFTFIGDVREVGAKMGALFAKLEQPVLTDLAVAWPGVAEVWPREPGDLYAGEPIVVVARTDAREGAVTITGRRAGVPWRASLPLSASASEPGIGVLWARAKIEALTDARMSGEPAVAVRKAIVDVALEHHLVSRYTSLVAVDVTATAPPGTIPATAALPANLPDGWSYDAVFGAPQTATPATLHLVLGLALLLFAVIAWSSARGKLPAIAQGD